MGKTDQEVFGVVAGAGLILIPLNGKAPVQKGWTERDYIHDDTLRQARSTGCNLGVRLTDEHLVVDVDPRNGGDESLAKLSSAIGIDLSDWTPATRTGSGGLHLWMKKPADMEVQGKLKDFPGIDLKTKGGQVVAPGSIHPDTGGIYVLDDPFGDLADLPELPQKLSDLIRKVRTRPERTEAPGDRSGSPGDALGIAPLDGWGVADPAEIAGLLEKLDPEDFRGEAAWFPLMCAVHFASGGEARAEFLEWSARDPVYADDMDKVATRWDSLDRKAGSSATGTLVMILREHGVVDAGFRFAAEREAEMEDFADMDGAELPEGVAEEAVAAKKAREKGNRDRPKVHITGSNRDFVLEETSRLLFKALGRDQLFYRGTELVNVSKIGETFMGADTIEWKTDDKGRKCFEKEGVRLYPGATIVSPLNGATLRYLAGKSIQYTRTDNRAKKAGPQPVDPPTDVIDLVNLSTLWLFQELMAMTMAPVVDFKTGGVLDQSGVLPGTGVLAKFDKNAFPGIRNDLTQEEATAKLDSVFDTLYRHFPFEGGPRGPSSAVNMTACLCALLRPVMDQGCPAHAFDAPQASSGKSKLSETHGILATGAIPAMAAWANNLEENEKRLGALLRRAPQVIVYDNLDAKNGDVIQFAHMNTAVTATKVTVRLLGASDAVDMPCLTFIEFNGNNIQVSGDMTTRVVKCRIDAKMANPETRVFDFDPVQRAQAMRGEIVAALLSVVASYVKAGNPCDNGLLPMRFGKAWRAVQGAVVWCGWEDPVKTVEEVMATDDRRALENEAGEVWMDAFGDKSMTAAELFRIFDEENGNVGDLDVGLIYEVIVTATSRPQALSKSLKDGKVFGDYLMRVDKDDSGNKTARLVRAA